MGLEVEELDAGGTQSKPWPLTDHHHLLPLQLVLLQQLLPSHPLERTKPLH